MLSGSGDAFTTLVNAIVGQQIPIASAAGIWGRLSSVYPELTLESLEDAPVEKLRKIGLSVRKAEHISGIVTAFVSGEVDDATWAEVTEREIHENLTPLRGVGVRTAEMVLIFHARLSDILPLGDIGLVNAAASTGSRGSLAWVERSLSLSV